MPPNCMQLLWSLVQLMLLLPCCPPAASSQPACALVSSGVFSGRADGGACVAGAQEREFGLWGTFRMVLFHGLPRAKQAALASIASGSSEILLTNYDTLRWATLAFDKACKSAAPC